MAENGIERIREAIARDQGHYAPSLPVTLCGTTDGTERRADWSPPLPPIPLWRRVGERLAGLVQCPSCLGMRFGPVHVSKLLLIGRH